MMRLILPLFLLGLAGVVFFQFTDPLMDEIKVLQVEKAKLEEGLDNARRLGEVMRDLLDVRNSFAAEDLDRLHKLLPDNVDNVRLIIDINNIAKPYDMTIRNIKIKADETKPGAETEAVLAGNKLTKGSVVLGFSVSGSYQNFKSFMLDLSRSLRVVDVSTVSFLSNDRDFYDYNVEIQTYWLK